MKNLKGWLEKTQSSDCFTVNNIIKISYWIILFLGITSLCLSIFVFQSEWKLISHPMQAVQGIIFAIMGLSVRHTSKSNYILVIYLIPNVLFSLCLAYQSNDFASIMVSTYTLIVPIIFSAFLLSAKDIVYTSIATFLGAILATYYFALTINITRYSITMATGMIFTSFIIYILRRLLDTRTKELIQATVSRDLFISKVSHELKNPLKGLASLTDIMTENETYSPEQIITINSMLRHTLGIVRQMENVKNILDGNIKLNYKRLDVVSEINTILQSFQIHQHIEIQFESESPSVFFELDKRSFYQIAFNLIDNAIKYSEEGYVHIFTGIDARGHLHFSVGNKGQWIIEEDIQSLFNIYERGSKHNSEIAGQGIGLSLVKENVSLHNGQIEFDPIYEFGVIVIVTIPPK